MTISDTDIGELRELLSKIHEDEKRLRQGEDDLERAKLCIDQAEQRLDTARKRVKAITGLEVDQIDLMQRVARHAEHFGRTHP